jgi:beta-N-acetylhexosaminidase
VAEALAAVQADTTPLPFPSRLVALRGALGASWSDLTDNPQRDRFVARITALHADTGAA